MEKGKGQKLVVLAIALIIITILYGYLQFSKGAQAGKEDLRYLSYSRGKEAGEKDCENGKSISENAISVPERLSWGYTTIETPKMDFWLLGFAKEFYASNWKETYALSFQEGYLNGFKSKKEELKRAEQNKSNLLPFDTSHDEGEDEEKAQSHAAPPVYTDPIIAECDYVINENTGKFHYKDCPSATRIKIKNRKYFTGTREELIEIGFEPCERCNP